MKERIIHLKRINNGDKSCIGELYFGNDFFSNTLEDPVRKPGVKIYGKTAIPAGKYKITIDFSEHFKKIMPHILNVPGFTGCRVHSGNRPEDTEGCILIGSYDGTDDFISGGISKGIFEMFMILLRANLNESQNNVAIIITNDFIERGGKFTEKAL